MPSQKSVHPGRMVRVAVTSAATFLVAYLLVCHLLIPELWVFRDRSLGADLGQMVMTTDDDIPGDPINVGLVGTKPQVIKAFATAGWNPADKITLLSSLEISLSVAPDRPDLDAHAPCIVV